MSMSRGFAAVQLSDSDQRLIALRESGYTGPINQDGDAVTTGPAAEILRALAEARGEVPDW
jgi:hypothetical protein